MTRISRSAVGLAAAGLFLASTSVAVMEGSGSSSPTGNGARPGVVEGRPLLVPGEATAAPAPAVAPPAQPLPEPEEGAPTGPVALPLPGCPPPPRPPGDPGPVTPSWRPSRLVPEAELPEPLPPPVWTAGLGPLEGKGMWLWKFRQSEGGDAQAIVDRAATSGLRQLWVRVGDSRDGFYAADVLADLVPRAHARGVAVIGWTFPSLWDPVADARWTAEALAWRAPDGAGLDGVSPDIERASEGVALNARRVAVHLDLVRRAAGDRLVVATVYRPTDATWATYPYAAIAPYVDAFAPMVYWGCTEPGRAATQALDRLLALRPVHLIGQGYDMAPEGGRAGPPSAEETIRFLDVARRGRATGASLWVWQSTGPEQWSALSAFAWPRAVRQ